MNAGQITMERTEARRRLRAYRNSIHTKADVEYQAAERAYAALEKGTPIIVLSQSFALATLDAKGRPNIAIARADERQVHLRSGESAFTFEPADWLGERSMVPRRQRVPKPSPVRNADGFALVPMVPPEVRGRRALDKHWILWEVERWADTRIGAQPDRDPLLLRHLGGEAFAVVGQWDLTDVERAIMSGTRTSR